MEAYLVTHTGRIITSCELVSISDDHCFADGPHADTVPFPVGSNQYLLSYDDGLDLCQTLGV
jgi:hypothetical protein